MPMPSPAPEPISSTRKKIKFDSPITVSRKSSTVTVRDQPTATIQDQPETGLDLNHTRYTPRLHYHSYDIAQAKLEYLLHNQPEMIINCSLVQREIVRRNKRKAIEMHGTHQHILAKKMARHEQTFVKEKAKHTKMLASVRAQTTKISTKSAKQNAQLRRSLTMVQNELMRSKMLLGKKEERCVTLRAKVEQLENQLKRHRKDMRQQLKKHGDEVAQIRKRLRQERVQSVSSEKEASEQHRRDNKQIDNLMSISESVQAKYDELYVQFSKQVLGPFGQERRALKKRISRLFACMYRIVCMYNV